MSAIQDSRPDDTTNNEVEEEVINEQNKPLRTDHQNYAQLSKRIKLDDPCQLVLLNEDILHHLFSFFNIQELVKMSHVCNVWQIVTRQKIKFASSASFYDCVNPVKEIRHDRLMNISLIQNVFEQTHKTVTHVTIEGPSPFPILFEEWERERQLQSARIITLEVCQILSDNCPNLTRLTLYSIKMSQTLCRDLGRCIPPNLKTLAIIKCHTLKDRGFKKILENCINLDKLLIHSTVFFNRKFTGLSIIESLKNGQLKKLSLVDCGFIDEWDESYLFRILEMFKSSLRQLNLKCMGAEEYPLGMNSNNLSDSKFNLLETLSLQASQADELTDPNGLIIRLYSSLKLFLNAMPNLITLKLHDCQFTVNKQCYFKLLPKYVPLLKVLHIVNSLPVYRKDIYLLSELENLETLVLCGLFDMHQDYNDEDDMLLLNDFENHECHSLPDQAKEALITDLVSVIIKCPKLKTVVLYDVPMLNDAHIFTMISSMSSLRLLKVDIPSSKITGSFVSKCTDLDRNEPITLKVNTGLYEHEVKKDPLPAIPPFMELYKI